MDADASFTARGVALALHIEGFASLARLATRAPRHVTCPSGLGSFPGGAAVALETTTYGALPLAQVMAKSLELIRLQVGCQTCVQRSQNAVHDVTSLLAQL